MDPPGTHPDRHEFVHTSECTKLWKGLVTCLEESNWIERSFLYRCENYYRAVEKCYRKERLMKKLKNYKEADRARARTVTKLASLSESADLPNP